MPSGYFCLLLFSSLAGNRGLFYFPPPAGASSTPGFPPCWWDCLHPSALKVLLDFGLQVFVGWFGIYYATPEHPVKSSYSSASDAVISFPCLRITLSFCFQNSSLAARPWGAAFAATWSAANFSLLPGMIALNGGSK